MDLRRVLFRARGIMPVPFIIAALIAAKANTCSIVVGSLATIAGEALRIWSIRYAGGATRTRVVGAAALVTTGPFAYVRNPLYIANMMIYAGCAVACGALFPYLPLAALICFTFQYGMIISLEEETLSELFGEPYADYCRGVPRLLPLLNPQHRWAPPNLSFNAALSEERRTLQGLGLVWMLLAVRLTLF